MRSSPNSSPVYSTCRLDWRPSRLLAAALVALGGLAAVSVCLSALPALPACLLAGVAFGAGLHAARRELSQASGVLSLEQGGGGRWRQCDGAFEMSEVRVRLRGPLASVAARGADGRRRRWHFWPDTLNRDARRRLRLLAGAGGGDAPVPTVAA